MAMQMHDNMLAVYPELLNRVRSIVGVPLVKEASDLAIFMSEAKTQRKVAPAHGAVYVGLRWPCPKRLSWPRKTAKEHFVFHLGLLRTLLGRRQVNTV